MANVKGETYTGGKPKHEPTSELRAQVLALATFGVDQESICGHIGIDVKTLYKYYRPELDKAAMAKQVKVRQFLFDGATGKAMDKHGATYSDCARLAMFWAKTQLGFSEKNVIDNISSDGSMTPKGKSLDDFYEDVSAKPVP